MSALKPYNRGNVSIAKMLRKNMTPWERKLWYLFLRTYPVRFRRQQAIGEYIVDFYCAQAKLIVELDGGGHYTSEQMENDTIRTWYLNSLGLTVVRICNLDVDRDFQGVCEHINQIVKSSL